MGQFRKYAVAKANFRSTTKVIDSVYSIQPQYKVGKQKSCLGLVSVVYFD